MVKNHRKSPKNKLPIFECPRVQAIFEAVKKNQGEPLFLKEAPHPRELTEVFNTISFEGLKQIPNTVIHANIASETYYPESPMPLTLGYILKGRMVIEKERHRIVLQDHSYHLTNASVFSTEAEEESEVFRISFQPGFLEKAFTDWTQPCEFLLDNPDYLSKSTIYFVEKFYPADQSLQSFLLQWREDLQSEAMSAWDLEEKFHQLSEHLLGTHKGVHEELGRLPSIKPSTRTELYRRLNLARDFIEDSLTHPLNLGVIAKTASLSKHHFLRLFKKVFKKTPYQYLLHRRLEILKNRLQMTSKSITELCYDLGFQDLSNLNHLFKREFGSSPYHYRRFKK